MLFHSVPCLPQHELEANQKKRQQKLQKQRRYYQYDHAVMFLESIALLNTSHLPLPKAERFTLWYWIERITATIRLPCNQIKARLWALVDPVDELQDYRDFFPCLPKPKVAKTYQQDEVFAEQRLAGANPMVIRRISELPSNFAFSVDELQEAVGASFDLKRALADENLYVADYRQLNFVEDSQYGRLKQFLPTPIAFFCHQEVEIYSQKAKNCAQKAEKQYRLMPVAIQIRPELGKDSPLITPASPPASPLSWQYAKLCVQIADANHHEMISHLGLTHFIMEPFAVSTARHLAQNHPLGMLLHPHFRFLLVNGHLGRTRLLGYIERLLPGTLEGSLRIVKKAHEDWSLDQAAFPIELKKRGMDDVKKCPHYPYRDDGMLLWIAIEKFVSEYLAVYYKTDQDINSDTELQAWAAELVSEHGGRIKGLKTPISSVAELTAIVTYLIFTCGPQHSAVNYSQYEYMTFMPNQPFAAYQPIRAKADISDENSLVPFLPPRIQAAEQLAILYILAIPYYYKKLGQYGRLARISETKQCIRNFQAELKSIEKIIKSENQRGLRRQMPYHYLHPDRISNSIML